MGHARFSAVGPWITQCTTSSFHQTAILPCRAIAAQNCALFGTESSRPALPATVHAGNTLESSSWTQMTVIFACKPTRRAGFPCRTIAAMNCGYAGTVSPLLARMAITAAGKTLELTCGTVNTFCIGLLFPWWAVNAPRAFSSNLKFARFTVEAPRASICVASFARFTLIAHGVRIDVRGMYQQCKWHRPRLHCCSLYCLLRCHSRLSLQTVLLDR